MGFVKSKEEEAMLKLAMLPQAKDRDGQIELQVIGAGFGRTGTLSLRLALAYLYQAPVYHYMSMTENGLRYVKSDTKLWMQTYSGESEHFEELFKGCAAAVDFPTALPKILFRLLVRYPKAKVILTQRDENEWYRSMHSTVYQFEKRVAPTWLNRIGFGNVHRICTMNKMLTWGQGGCFDGKFHNKEYAIQCYRKHIQRVRDAVPAENLLVFDVKKHGWKELCDFLEKPIPQCPFPHANDKAAFKKRVDTLVTVSFVLPAVFTAFLGLLIALFVYRPPVLVHFL